MTAAAAEPIGWTLIVAERTRQLVVEGFTAEHDDRHVAGELHAAARCYLSTPEWQRSKPSGWPWDVERWKPSDRASNLVAAGALLLAEADRLARAGKAPAARRLRAQVTQIADGLTRLLLAASTTRP